MVVRMRLARFGRRHLPFYRLVVADSKMPRSGKHIEKLGHYNPLPDADGNKALSLNEPRVKYWLSVGAQPTNTVAKLLGRVGVLPPFPRPNTPKLPPKQE
eukprot:PRCOL_00003143-RA